MPLIDIRLSQMEPTDLRGIPFRKGDNVEWSVPSMLPDATRHGAAGILFLDEINAAPPTVSAAARVDPAPANGSSTMPSPSGRIARTT